MGKLTFKQILKLEFSISNLMRNVCHSQMEKLARKCPACKGECKDVNGNECGTCRGSGKVDPCSGCHFLHDDMKGMIQYIWDVRDRVDSRQRGMKDDAYHFDETFEV